MAVGSEESVVRVLRIVPNARALARPAFPAPITALRLAPDRESIAVAPADGRLRVVAIASSDVVAELDFDA
jgi:hypothetical protein